MFGGIAAGAAGAEPGGGAIIAGGGGGGGVPDNLAGVYGTAPRETGI
jgi:hypothetical protein